MLRVINLLVDVPLLALTSGAITLALTKAKISDPLRSRVSKWPWVHYLMSCPFCMGFWISLLVTFAFTSYTVFIALSVWGLSVLFIGLMLRALFIHENEISLLEEEIADLQKIIHDLNAE